MAGIPQPGIHAVNTSGGATGGTGGHATPSAPSTTLPGYPSVVQNTPDEYIRRLLEENGNPTVETTPIQEGGGHGGGGAHGATTDRNRFLKWGVGLLVVGALFKLAITKKTSSATSSLRNRFFPRRPAISPNTPPPTPAAINPAPGSNPSPGSTSGPQLSTTA